MTIEQLRAELRHRVRLGFLLEHDVDEIVDTILLIESFVALGAISEHFAEQILESLANEKRDAWLERTLHLPQTALH